MRDEVRIHLHSDSAVPGTRWWAESDSGFTGGSDLLSELVSVILDWAETDGIEVSFVLVMEEFAMEESFSESRYVEPVIHSGAEAFATPFALGGWPRVQFGQVPLRISV
ncbi:MAG: hypothetical protein F4138_08170 [Acidimicrobiia bacterium]|nr:hypothetical protein [Acidimicrobiia bacterium]